jgi:hypothetical protein
MILTLSKVAVNNQLWFRAQNSTRSYLMSVTLPPLKVTFMSGYT